MTLARLAKTFGITLLGIIGMFYPYLASADPSADGNLPVDRCDSLRLGGKCKPAPLSAEDNMREAKIPGNKVEVVKKLTIPEQPMQAAANACDAHFSITYAQRNDQIKVDTSVGNSTCAASHGEYSLRIRTITAAGEALTRSFSEPWSRHDDGVVQVTKHYPMGPGGDLVWVRVNSNRKTACACD